MPRIIDYREDEEQQTCHNCGSIVGYTPEEQQEEYTPWHVSYKYDKYFYKKTLITKTRFKQYFIICPNCGEKIYTPHTFPQHKSREVEGNVVVNKVKVRPGQKKLTDSPQNSFL